MDSEASNSENFESSRDIQRNRDNNVDKSCMVAVQPHRDAIGAKQLTMNQKSEPNRNNSEEKKNEKERDTVITVTQNDERLVPVIVVKPRTDKQIIEDQLNSILARQEKSEELKKSESNKAAIEQLIAFSKTAVIECNNKQSTLDRNISPIESPNSVLSSDNAQNIPEASNSIEASTSSESSPMVINDKKTYDRTQNVIEMMVDAYQAMCERRRLVYCPRSLKDLLSGTQPVPRSCKWGERFSPEQMRIEVAFMVEFINSIHPFAKFSLNDRMELFRNIALACVMLEKHYLTMKLGGISQSRLYHQDHSYSDLNDEDALVPKHDVSCDMDTLRK
ncbi:hypothetical protein WR25_07123 isoform C [Diploscapter pachys]|uniref:NR LBD domain-containing protein n=2 Tax=Diploscapter pachys TaxID=2018661 RepID=A0A2A2JFA2_9BILA|nr:hypothetical protein WR25_07123 isoform B [Diploscapter pachys]PAV60249.1 hypothetical protein WR25_07123 isoform C [Diploscapter pachys]